MTKMRDLFESWRRKTACITLLMAVLLAGAWSRSTIVADTLKFNVGGRRHHIGILPDKIVWRGHRIEPQYAYPFEWFAAGNSDLEAFFAMEESPPRSELDVAVWIIPNPYPYTVWPLTVLSVCLLGWKKA